MRFALIIFLILPCSSTIYAQIVIKNQNKIDELYPIATNPQKATDERLTAYRECCWFSAYQDYTLCLRISSEFYSLATDKKIYDMQISALHYKGHSLMMLGQLDAAHISFDEALAVAKKHNFNRMEAEAYGDLGNLLIKQGNVEEALVCHQKSDSIANKHDLKVAKARAKINSGEIYETNGEYKKSLIAFKEALEICEANGYGGFLSSIHEKLGDVNHSIEEYEIAKEQYNLSYHLAKKHPNVGRQISALKKLGELHRELGNADSARIYFDKAIELSRRKMVPDLEAALLASIARLYLDQNSIDIARRTIEEALALYKLRKTFEGRDNAFYIAGEIYSKMEKSELAIQSLNESYTLSVKSGNVFIREKSCLLLATIYKETGKYRLSTNFYEEYLTLRDKRRGQEDVKAILRLNIHTEYLEQAITDSIHQLNAIDRINREHEQFKERERNKTNLIYIGIAVLVLILVFAIYSLWIRRKRTRLLRHKNTVIKGALNDKEMLLKEVHHRVKNNMQVVSSLLYLKSKSTENEAAKEVLLDSQKRIDSMLLAHQKMYRNNNFEEIEIVEYVNDIFRMLLERIKREQDSFNIVSDGKIFLQVEKAQALGFVIHELVTNSIKYAWPNQDPNAKLIELEFMVSEESVGFTYLDNGVGLPDKIDTTKIDSFGLKMINSLVTKQLLGTIEMDGERGLRTEIKFGK